MRLLSLLSLVVGAAMAFPPGRNGGWSTVTGDVGLGFNSRILAVADWSNSQNADLVTVDANNTVSIYSWTSDSHTFGRTYDFPFGDEVVIGGVVADINRDGQVDFALTTDAGKLHIIYGPNTVARDVMPSVALHGSVPHLNVLNLYGKCAVPDLVVLTAGGYLAVLKNQIATGPGKNCEYLGGPATFVVEANVTLPDPRMALKVGALDFDGDCQSEFLSPESTSDSIATRMTVRDVPGSAVVQSFSVPSFFGAPTYGDMNGDGTTDIIYPACVTPTLVAGSSDTYQCSVYNAAAIVRNALTGSVCGAESCCAGHGSQFPTVTYTAEGGYSSNGAFSLMPFNCQSQNPFAVDPMAADGPDATLLDTPQYPAIIRVFDYNRDTHTDLLIATTWGPMVLTNEGGAKLVCNALDLPTSKVSEGFRESIPFPFDISDDGSIDVLTFPIGSSSGGGINSVNGTITAYWNGFGVDEDYFFTAAMLNGVSSPTGGYPHWGAVQPGAVHRFQWQDIDTNTRTATVTQYSSSSAHTLLLPHAHFGLGRTFSPIQNYGTGVRNGADASAHFIDWTAYLMPNSQVVVLAKPIDDPSQWSLRLFLYTLTYKRIILIALPTVLAMIGIPILVLKCKEMKYDRAEKRQQMS